MTGARHDSEMTEFFAGFAFALGVIGSFLLVVGGIVWLILAATGGIS